MARDGIDVVFSFAHEHDTANEVATAVEAAGARAWPVQADLADRAAALRLFDTAENLLDGLDILVNNAGSSTVPQPISQTSDADYGQLMAVNTRAVFTLMREAATRLRDNGPIVNISTVNTVAPNPAVVVHAASKAAVEQLTACSARELGPRGITVNSVSPGATDTDLLRGNNPDLDVEATLAPMTPLGRLGQPADIAAVVAFLVSPDG